MSWWRRQLRHSPLTSAWLKLREHRPAPRAQHLMRSGAAVQVLSTATIVLTNLLLPLVLGREVYGAYVVILGASYFALALISSPADTTYILRPTTAAGSTAAPEAGYMPAKSLITALVAGVAGAGAGLPLPGVIAAMLLAAGHALMSGALHQFYRSGSGRRAVKTGLLMAVPTGFVPLVLGKLLGPTVLGLTSGAVSCLLGFALQSRGPASWSLGQIPLGCRQVATALGRQAWPSYLNSGVPWLAILRLGASRPASTAVLKLAFSLMNAGQSLIPITSSIVLAATLQDDPDQRRSTVRLLWWCVIVFGLLAALGLRIMAPVLGRFYGSEFPNLIRYIPLAGAGVAACTVYWIFWPVSLKADTSRLLGSSLVATTVATAAAVLVFGTSAYICLLIYVVGITVGAVLATARSTRRPGEVVFALATLLALLYWA